jgi:hypothetical protein
VIANISIPTKLALVAEIRDRLVKAVETFGAECVEGQRVEAEWLQTRTASNTTDMSPQS